MATSPALADRSTAAPAAPAAAGTGRLAALDAWRGLTVGLMLLVNNVALGSLTPGPLRHAPWGGAASP
ncbi:hypothetical protein [Deinococcus budaensis]|uniref:Putative acyltransferase n=1 Tax=Deinococcus budaensis TaxID=1665626 RepID=A0A7W8GGH1_9DEIO|nr:hypothetical protein [Deinococcus budaensis]MBB5234788.1 putative acyltransferase [Deinococcus budaensis]